MTTQISVVIAGFVAIVTMGWLMHQLMKFLPYAFALVLASPALIVDASYDLAKKLIDHE